VSGQAPAAVGLALLLAAAPATQARQHKPEDPVPPGATAKVLSVSGKILELRGLSLGVSGKAVSLEAALKDLGAKVTEQEIRIDLSADVLFDFDKADLRNEAAPALEKVAAVLKAYPAAAVAIEGHTDSKGNDQYNQALSERRAASVRGWLGGHGVGNPITTRGWGAKKPVAPNSKPGGADDPEGRQKNRRVEITLKKA
jgi:outer membrane protein OmpA-like peptidoglycan-associated protein